MMNVRSFTSNVLSSLSSVSLSLPSHFIKYPPCQVSAIHQASYSIKDSSSLRKVLEVILAIGNYMNCNKKGLASGFKIQSLSKVRGNLVVCVKCNILSIHSLFLSPTLLVSYRSLPHSIFLHYNSPSFLW